MPRRFSFLRGPETRFIFFTIMQVNRDQLAEILGCSKPTIDAKLRRGMPFVQQGARGRAWVFDVAQVIEWEKTQAVKHAVGNVEESNTTEELNRRLLEAQVTKAEVDAALAKDRVVLVEEMERAASSSAVAVRQAMRQIPSRAALRLLGEKSETVFKEILTEEIDSALSALADSDLLEGFEDAGDE